MGKVDWEAQAQLGPEGDGAGIGAPVPVDLGHLLNGVGHGHVLVVADECQGLHGLRTQAELADHGHVDMLGSGEKGIGGIP